MMLDIIPPTNKPVTAKKPTKYWLVLMLIFLLAILLIWAARCQKLPVENQLPIFNDQTQPVANDNTENNTAINNTTKKNPTTSCQTSANGYTTQRIQGLIQLDEASFIKFFTAKITNGNQALKDIQELTCLEKLTIFNDNTNNITNLTPLANLTRLQILEIDGTNVTDLTPLSYLTSLTTLMLADFPITNLTGVGNLTNLTFLNLAGDDKLSDISALRNLAKLVNLGLSSTNIADLSPITSLHNLQTLTLANTNWSQQVLAGVNPVTDPNWQSKLIYPSQIDALLTANSSLQINWLQFQIK